MALMAGTTVLAYLLGSIPFTYLAGRLWLGIDLSARGSGNLGGTNAVRVLGLVPGVLVGLADVGKASLAVFAARRLVSDPWGPALAAVAACLGHCYSLYLGFAKGGKGVSPAIGSFLVLAPFPTALGLAAGIAPIVLTRFVSLGALTYVSVLPILFLVFGLPLPWTVAAVATGILSFWRHRMNISRLRLGTERRLGVRE